MRTVWWILACVVGIAIAGYVLIATAPSPTERAVESAQPETYTSYALGVQFRYLPVQPGGVPASVWEASTTIYVYTGSTTPEAGQSVQVFAKRADETLKAAIRRQILAAYPSPDCAVIVTPSNIQSGYQVAEITYPRPEGADQPWYANAALCNETYDQTNGMRYFLYDPRHPDTFAFLDIGQYSIFGHDQIPWQYTLTFID
jgi:hypothetical protein